MRTIKRSNSNLTMMKRWMMCACVTLALLVLSSGYMQAQVTGNGTAGQIPVWTGSTQLGDSIITQRSCPFLGCTPNLGIGTDPTGARVTVDGAGNVGIVVFSSDTGIASYSLTGFAALEGRSLDGHGVFGRSENSWGVRGDSQNHEGVLGLSSAPGKSGVVGRNDLATSYGVFGYSLNGTGVGGRSAGLFATGVDGVADGQNGNGVVGLANNGASAYGVWGRSTSGFAGYFSGRVHVAGTLSKAAGSFKIDHPLDPENKYLSHSFVESPDMLNIYNGNVTTNENGEAVVTLPDYFTALNRDYRYQLTVIGQFAQAIIASKIADNRFTVQTDKPHVEVSWQVTGIRQDEWANRHRIVVEEDKPDGERGHYLHPELFNAPEEKSIEWARKPEAMKRLKEQANQAPPQP